MTQETKKLYQLKLFWTALILPISTGLIIALAIIYNGDYALNLTAAGFNNLLTDFKVALGSAGLAIPFVAVVAAIHRSEQTAKQIETQSAQNNFTNHFKHLEEHNNFINQFGYENPPLNIHLLHRAIYPNTMQGDISIRSEIYQIEKTTTDKINYFLKTKEGIGDIDNSAKAIRENIEALSGLDIYEEDISPPNLITVIEIINRSAAFSGINTPPAHKGNIVNSYKKLYKLRRFSIELLSEEVSITLKQILYSYKYASSLLKSNFGEEDLNEFKYQIIYILFKKLTEEELDNIYTELDDQQINILESVVSFAATGFAESSNNPTPTLSYREPDRISHTQVSELLNSLK